MKIAESRAIFLMEQGSNRNQRLDALTQKLIRGVYRATEAYLLGFCIPQSICQEFLQFLQVSGIGVISIVLKRPAELHITSLGKNTVNNIPGEIMKGLDGYQEAISSSLDCMFEGSPSWFRTKISCQRYVSI